LPVNPPDPNPSQGIFNVSINQTLHNPQIHITDFRGSLVKTLRPQFVEKGRPFQINLGGFPKGVYFLKLQDIGFAGVKIIIID